MLEATGGGGGRPLPSRLGCGGGLFIGCLCALPCGALAASLCGGGGGVDN